MTLCVELQEIMLTDNKYNYFRIIMIVPQSFHECKRFFFSPLLLSPLQHNSLSSFFVPTFCSSCNTGTVPRHMKAIVLWIIRLFAWNKMDAETLCLTKVPLYLCPGFFSLVFEALLEYVVSQGSIKGSYFLRGFSGCRISFVLRKLTLKQ